MRWGSLPRQAPFGGSTIIQNFLSVSVMCQVPLKSRGMTKLSPGPKVWALPSSPVIVTEPFRTVQISSTP